MLTEQEVYDYLGYDIADDTIKRNVLRMIRTADAYLKGAIGRDYPANDPRAKELALIIIGDLSDNRGMSEKVSGVVRRLVSDFTMQLQVEEVKRLQDDSL